jgi:hypothetical protein
MASCCFGLHTQRRWDSETAIDCADELKVAVMLLTNMPGVKVQVVAVPTHEPDQLTKVLPVAGTAVRVTGSLVNKEEHTLPQLIPVGLDVTVPEPVPDLATMTVGRTFTVSVSWGGFPLILTRAPLRDGSMYTGDVPRSAVLAVAIVSVVWVVPSGSDVGLNVAVTPEGRLPGLTKRVPFNPLDRETVTLTVPVCP